MRPEVIDGGGPTIPARQDCGELAVTGRGLALIEDLAVRSGWFTDDKGLLHAWFEVEPAT